MAIPLTDYQLKKGVKIRVPGVVYCLEHGAVHEDSLDPYDEGYKTCWANLYGERTKAMVHRTVYYQARKGDVDERKNQ